MDAITSPRQIKERPIIFSAAMVRAILGGRKTQTRRICKVQPKSEYEGGDMLDGYAVWIDPKSDTEGCECKCAYGQPGDRLWVRESFQYFRADEEGPLAVAFKAGCADDRLNYVHQDGSIEQINILRWKPSIHMPRWASRITLEIVSVRVERLHDISDADAVAEGVTDIQNDRGFETSFTYGFLMLWDKVHGRASTDANPWVWVIEFKRVGE
jgi:hypothetical protein